MNKDSSYKYKPDKYMTYVMEKRIKSLKLLSIQQLHSAINFDFEIHLQNYFDVFLYGLEQN